MATAFSRDVILVGFTRHKAVAGLEREFRGCGLHVREAASEGDVLGLLAQTPRAAVVVYCPESSDAAHRVLQVISDAQRPTAVVALVDHSDFGDYYALMAEGASQYYEVDETPQRILRGVTWAARSDRVA